MATYGLYLESGPRRRKTMVHVLDLLGCVATGPTTDAALAASPDAIRAYLRFLQRHGEPVAADEPITTEVIEHVTEGLWIGNGSPAIVFGPDLEPISAEELEALLRRFRWMRETLAVWATTQTEAQLDAPPAEGGRTGRAVLLHVLGATGGYLSAALGSARGFSAIQGAAERRELSLPDALRRSCAQAVERLRATTDDERATVRQRSSGPTSVRKAVRRLLEHEWEHLAELARRPGGPPL
ncbi:MAG: DinB family protein [Sphaerobacter sp.]|nr:DinB family protein [Sphaerobacter sp.]